MQLGSQTFDLDPFRRNYKATKVVRLRNDYRLGRLHGQTMGFEQLSCKFFESFVRFSFRSTKDSDVVRVSAVRPLGTLECPIDVRDCRFGQYPGPRQTNWKSVRDKRVPVPDKTKQAVRFGRSPCSRFESPFNGVDIDVREEICDVGNNY